jgi:hypothetical protein
MDAHVLPVVQIGAMTRGARVHRVMHIRWTAVSGEPLWRDTRQRRKAAPRETTVGEGPPGEAIAGKLK